jgi:hypothetical protein
MINLFFMTIQRLLMLLLMAGSAIGISGCRNSNESISPAMNMTQNIYIEVGESPEALIGRYGKAVEANDKNPGSRFLRMNWPVRQPATLGIKNGNSMLYLNGVFSTMGTYNSDFPDEGLSNYGISLGISKTETIFHDEARVRFFDLLKQIRQAEWKRWIKPDRPRLLDENAFRYNATEYPIYSLDDTYIPSLSDWMKLQDGSSWRFYQNRVYMTVTLYRDSSRMNPELPGAYFITIDLVAQASQWRREFDGDDRKRWKELYKELRKKGALERAELEKKLQTQGYKIDSNYQNPDESLLNN